MTLLACQVLKWRRPIGQLVEGDGRESDHVQTRARHAELAVARSVGWAVTRAGRYGVFRPQCLVRSLAIQTMLRRRGIATSTLSIGVRMEDGVLAAHAWVELGDAVVGDSIQNVRAFSKVTDLRLVEL